MKKFFQILFFWSLFYSHQSWGFDDFLKPRPLPDFPEVEDPSIPVDVGYSLGYGRPSRFEYTKAIFYLNQEFNRVSVIRIFGEAGVIQIKSVIIYYPDGQRRDISQLRGPLTGGSYLEVFLERRTVYSVEVEAKMSSFFRKSGDYRVDVIAGR